MIQTDHTCIVLRYANYRENDRMLTLLSPRRGRIDALCRGCRRPRSPLLSCSELFSLGEYQLLEKNGRMTVTSALLTESFYPLRQDFDRLACGTYLLNLAEAAAQPGEEAQELFLLLLHALSRLTFSDQPWKPLLAGFLLHYANTLGYKPRLEHCVTCGRRILPEEKITFDMEAGGVCCSEHGKCHHLPLPQGARRWMMNALQSSASQWVDTSDSAAPFALLRVYVESRLERKLRSGQMLPRD